jgi:serine/threonine protein phosphatase PrpC
MLPAIEFAEKTDPGRDPDKQVNEDASGYRETPLGHLCVLCDGMGGHQGGREASHTALATIIELVSKASTDDNAGVVLGAAIQEANRRVYALTPPEMQRARAGSTVVAILMHAQGTEVAHVGDSRCYLLHEAQVFQVTKDHSAVQQLVDRGVITPAQAVGHPQANQITRALGMFPEVDVEVRQEPVRYLAGDAFVLCSDGLSDLVEPSEVLEVVGTVSAEQATGKLVDLANARGGHDNITIQILRAKVTAEGREVPLPRTEPGTTAPEKAAASERKTEVGIPLQAAAIPPPAPLQGVQGPSPLRRDRGAGMRRELAAAVAISVVALLVLGSVVLALMQMQRRQRSLHPALNESPPASSR